MSFFKNLINEKNTNPFLKTYNSQSWIIQATLTNIKRSVNIVLSAQHINEIIIYNDIECYSPTLILKYMDIHLDLVHILDNNNLMIKLCINQPSPNPDDPYYDRTNLLNLDLVFNIDKISTIYKKTNTIIYQFEGTHCNQSTLLKNINYATSKDLKNSLNTKESPLVIINKILSQVEYPTDTIVNDSLNKVEFITSQTMTVKDCIDHLLRKAITIHDPPTYFVHNMKTGKAMLINNKNIELRLNNPTNDFNVFGKPNSKDLHFDLATEAVNIKQNSFNTGAMALRYLGDFNFVHFDQNTRSWTNTIFNYNIINNMFNSWVLNSNPLYESIFPEYKKVEENGIKYNFPNYNELKMYLFLRELQLGTNTITFNVLGNVTRDAGQYVNLACSNEAQIPKYEGLWHIYSCEHRWEGKMYTNELVCYRTFQIKPLTTKNESQLNI